MRSHVSQADMQFSFVIKDDSTLLTLWSPPRKNEPGASFMLDRHCLSVLHPQLLEDFPGVLELRQSWKAIAYQQFLIELLTYDLARHSWLDEEWFGAYSLITKTNQLGGDGLENTNTFKALWVFRKKTSLWRTWSQLGWSQKNMIKGFSYTWNAHFSDGEGLPKCSLFLFNTLIYLFILYTNLIYVI